MKNKMRTVIGCAVSACAIVMLSQTTVQAATGTDIEDSVWTYRAVANVETQVNIRAYGSTDSAIIGYLPKGASADLIEKGETWSHIISNGVEGYIKNEYLAFGEEAEYLASVYGTPGVKINWDDVRLFEAPDAAASILDTANEGSEYTILDEQGMWYLVQMDDATAAYVPAEDVEKTIITERAISVAPVVDETAESGNEMYDASENAWTEDAAQDQEAYSAPETYTEPETNNYAVPETYEEQEAGEDAAPETEAYDTLETEEPAWTPESGEVSDAPASSGSEETVAPANADDLNLLAAIIYCEAGNQSREGKVAVGAVVLNRVASASFPNTIHDVIYQSGQFTPAYSGGLASALANGVPSDCTEAAQAALNGENPVGGALYFNTGSGKGMKIGAHQFY